MSANKSVVKALKILELISKHQEGITLSEIYKELDMPKATVYDILQALYAEDAVYYKNEIAKTYVIGSKIFAIGQAYTKNSNFISFASPLLRDFADKYGVTVFACKRLGTKISNVFKYESTKSRLVTPDVGVQTQLYENVAGMAFLTYLNEEKVTDLLERIYKQEFKGKHTNTYKEIISKIEKYKQADFILDNGETDSFVCEIAVPVYNFEKKMTGVIYAVRLAFDEQEEMDSYVKEFKEIAEIISSKQGYKR